MTIELQEVRLEEKSILENMLHFYLDDLSKYTNQLKANQLGIFEYDSIDLFFTKTNLIPYFIKYEGLVVGFLLFVKTIKNAQIDYCVNDIFIFTQYRERGFAGQAVKKLFSAYPGTYYVVQLEKNKKAIQFWRSLFTELHLECTEKPVIDSGERCWAQTFTIR
ncbi:GNAT family N-acetyltransferase [Heyndrickxia vini]|uniref:GNAT family N-acetyltransferase n=1 Tax=Heyndrickxia vini TaxID=1476025 RepID=A0ABX7E0W1_9BACI|nr:GNAT family N-acetyltransferase [Heyndrickxia vini]QQZ08869.1 GNAT family N-acetyltransferase [Heyndrickxia vini]